MGYYSNYKLHAPDLVADYIQGLSGYSGWWRSKSDSYNLEEAKWYDRHEHCNAAAQHFPDEKFWLEVEGEEQGDSARIYCWGGQCQFVTPIVIWVEPEGFNGTT